MYDGLHASLTQRIVGLHSAANLQARGLRSNGNEAVIVEIKSIERFERIHIAQLLTCLRITGLSVGLVVNFNTAVLKDIRSVVL